jgi:type VI secretion system secreted protein VgrG
MADYDYSLACEAIAGVGNPWQPLQVVQFRGHEAISELFRYEITLLAKGAAAEIDPRDLIGKRLSLRIATMSIPAWKIVHGIVEEASDLDDVPEGSLMRVVLVAPWARAMRQQRCRVFLDKTLRQIITAVLEGDPLVQRTDVDVESDDGAPTYTPALERFTWRIQDTSRIDNVRAHPFVVQYNESDFAFVARLLEEEGMTFHFENGSDTCLLVLTDHDGGRARLSPDLPIGPSFAGRKVDSVKLGARLRPTAVVLDDHEWRKPNLDMRVQAGDGADDLVEYHYPGSYFDAPGQGKPVAAARIDRYRIESRYALGSGSVRLLDAGSIFKLVYDLGDHDGEYLVTSIDVQGEQQGVISLPSSDKTLPWEARFELARRGIGQSVEQSQFRPARKTPKPRIRGLQTAIVTADPGAPGAEINVGGPDGISIGCVRIRFRWDTETARLAKESSSHWVRVSQIFAGSGEGAVFHPRVGDEVLVDFEDGDPDRPVVVGRVYNGANLPMHGKSSKSSLKSLSTPGGGTYNEIMFDDEAGRELLHYYAGKDQTTDVANMRRESVVTNATMKVGGNNAEKIGANRKESVGGNDTLHVGANQDILIGVNSTTVIGGNFKHSVGANEVNGVGVSQINIIGGNVTETVGSLVTESYGASRTTWIGGAINENFGAVMSTFVSSNVTETYGSHSVKVAAARLIGIGGSETNTINAANTTKVGALILDVSGGAQTLTVDGNIVRNAPIHLVIAATDIEEETESKINVEPLGLSITGFSSETLDVALSETGISGSITGMSISLFAMRGSWTGAGLDVSGIGLIAAGIHQEGGGVDNEQ